MGVDPGRVELALYGDQSPIPATSSFASTWQGTAGLYQAVGDKFRISIEASHLGDPLSVVATMAHELGHVHLLGGGRLTGDEEDHEPLTDLLTVYLGLGVLTANSVVRESSWKDGNMSGWSISRCGYTDMRTYGYALARFARLRDEDAPPWSRQLRPDVRQAFRQSARFLQAEATAAP